MRPTPQAVKAELEKAAEGYAERRWIRGARAGEYLASRGIEEITADTFMLGWTGDNPLPGDPENCLSIPNISAGGVVGLKFRRLDDGSPRYLGRSLPGRLYNTRAVVSAEDTICITEGELDCIVLVQCGYSAVAAPGANSWKAHHARVFAGFSRVLVFGDGDEAGREFSRRVVDCVPAARSVIMGPGQDINELFLEGGEAAVKELIESGN